MMHESSKSQAIIAIICFEIKQRWRLSNLDYIKINMRVCGILYDSCMNVKYVWQKYYGLIL